MVYFVMGAVGWAAPEGSLGERVWRFWRRVLEVVVTRVETASWDGSVAEISKNR